MTDLSPYMIRNLFKYLAIKAHYLFRQCTEIKTLIISKHDWKHYEDNHNISVTQFKTLQYIIKKNKDFDYGKDSEFRDIDEITFFVGYRIIKESKVNKPKENKKAIEIHMIINPNQIEMELNDIFKDIISFDFTSNSLFNDYQVLSNRDLNKMIKIINRDIPKEYKYIIQYKLIESEYFENPHYLLYNQYIPAQGIKHQLRHIN